MRADNSRHLVEAARKRSERTRRRTITAIRRLAESADPVSFEIVAREAGVSRSWLYAQPDLRAQIQQLRSADRRSQVTAPPARQRATDASLLRRLEAATDRIRQLEHQNRDSATHSPMPSASTDRPPSPADEDLSATRRRSHLNQISGHADGHPPAASKTHPRRIAADQSTRVSVDSR